MTRRTSLLVVLVAVIGVIGWYVYSGRGGRSSDGAATASVSQPSGSNAGSAPGSHSTASAANARPDAPATVAVAVTDASGALAGAAVRAQPTAGEDGDADDRDVVLGKTGSDGKATLTLAPGAWSISASATGHLASAVAQTVKGGDAAQVSLVLATGGKLLTGTVTDALGGPVAGARIDAAKLESGIGAREPAIASALTGADGKYQVTVPQGMLFVAATEPSYAPQARPVQVGESGAVADFALVPGGVIEGIVRDERTKEPVPAAQVTATRDGGGFALVGESNRRRATTGADGKFRLAGLRPGAYDLAAKAGLEMSRSPTRLGLGVAEQLGEVEILVGVAPVIRGKVLGESGLAAPGVDVYGFAQKGGSTDEHGKSGADGTFALVGLPPGRYQLMGQGGGQLPDGTTPVELVDKDVEGVVVKVRAAGGVTGRVEPPQVCEVRFDLDPHALRDGSMPMLVRPTTSRPDGTFALSPVSPGKGTVGARCQSGDQGTAEVTVAPGAPEVVVKVTPGASIAGRVVDDGGKPLAGVSVMATPQTGSEHVVIMNGMITSGAQALTGLDGTYEVKGLTAGTYRMAVLGRGKPLPPAKDVVKVTLAVAEKKSGVELAVSVPDGTIAGTVVDGEGKPVADAWVSVHQDLRAMVEDMRGNKPGELPPEGSQWMSIEATSDDPSGGGAAMNEVSPVLTDASGKFAIRGLARGRYEVVAEAQQGKLRGRATAVKPDATIAITAVGITKLTGTVKAGSPITVFDVELDGPTQTSRGFAAGGTTGTFELARVDPGTYTVHVSSSAGNGQAQVTVKPNETATVDIALVANAVIVGKLVDAAGKPANGVGVAVVPDADSGGVTLRLEGPPPSSAADGSFRVEAPAGKSVLVVMTPPKPITKRGLMLEAGKTLDVGTIKLE